MIYLDFSAALTQEEANRCIDYIRTISARSGFDGSSRWSSGEILHQHPYFKKICRCLTTLAQRPTTKAVAWANIVGPGGSIHRHSHEPYRKTGVFYFTDGADIEFDGGRSLRPHPGLAIVFDGSLEHWVGTQGHGDRISLAMNFP